MVIIVNYFKLRIDNISFNSQEPKVNLEKIVHKAIKVLIFINEVKNLTLK